MFKDSLKKISIVILQIFFVILVSCFILVDNVPVYAAQESRPTEAEYRTQYEDAVKLADMLRESSYLIHNKLYTAEQEVQLQALVDSVCGGSQSDRSKADALLTCINDRLEPGECCELNGWDTLCDGDTEMTIDKISGADGSAPKRQADQQSYCFTFYDVCRLANIPCFILEDCKGEYEINNKYICMVYIDNVSGTGKDWYFADVMAENNKFIAVEEAYDVMGDEIFPMNILFDYDKMIHVMNVIFLNKETILSYSRKSKVTPYLAYDRDENMVKTYFRNGDLADGEQYSRTEAKVGENGEPPLGWIQTKKYYDDTVTTYLHYSLYGVILRGRVYKDDTEYNLQGAFNGTIPYNVEVGNETESEEHKAYIAEYRKKQKEKVIKIAEALLQDENYIWDDTNFNEEDEALLKEAVKTALNWENIIGDEWCVRAFENAGISLDDEDPDNLSEKAKAQAILYYIKKNVESVPHAPLIVNSAYVLREGEGTCDGITLLYRDMCVMAGLKCFSLLCSMDMDIGDTLSGDHGNNLVKAGDEWLFCDPTNSGVVGKGAGFQLGISEGYNTYGKTIICLDHESMRRNTYYKWRGDYNLLSYYDFDSEGNLGIYLRDRYGNSRVIENDTFKTDENGRYLEENGLHTVDKTEDSEDGTARVVNRYAYYYQNGRLLLGKKVINGKEYNFGTDDAAHYAYHKVEELSRRYFIAKLRFVAIEDQPYDKAGVCPIPEIYHGDKKLELGKDFRIVEYTHNKEVTSYVDASYKVEGIGDYIDEATRTFKIVKADISNVNVKLSETNYVWTPGKYYYKPDVDLDLDWQDYSVRYYDYDNIGQAKVVITGTRNYTGSITKYYNITKRVWNEKDFKILDRNQEPLQSQEFSYNFYSVTPEAKVYWYDEDGSKQSLLEGYDYDISYSDSTKPGIVTVTATAKGKYQGSLTCTYKINKYDIGNNSGVSRFMSNAQSEQGLKVIYTGRPVLPKIPDFGNLEENVHYTMTVTDNVNVGTTKLTLQGIGVCTGTYVAEFEVIPYHLSSNSISIQPYSTTGEALKKPLVTIKANLVEGRDYFISYEKEVDGTYQEAEPVESGRYRVAIRGTDNVEIEQTNDSDTDAQNCYYYYYNIISSGSTNTGSEAGDGTSATGNTGKENGTTDNNSVTEDAASKEGTNHVSAKKNQESIASNSAYAIKKLKLSSQKKAIKLSWTKVKKADGYQIQISLYKNYKKVKTIHVKKSKISYTFKKLKKNKKYYIRIRAYSGKGNKKICGKWQISSKKTK